MEFFENEDEIKKIFENVFYNKTFDIEDKRNIFVECTITSNEAINGCYKKIKFSQINEFGKKEKSIISVKIPPKVQTGQKIVLREQGNYISDEKRRSNLVINIKVN